MLSLDNETGFDALISHSLSHQPSHPARGFPSRSILDFARGRRIRSQSSPIDAAGFIRACEIEVLI